MRAFTNDLRTGHHITWNHNATRGTISGTVTAVKRRDTSFYYFIDVTLDSGENIRIQKHKNTVFYITKD